MDISFEACALSVVVHGKDVVRVTLSDHELLLSLQKEKCAFSHVCLFGYICDVHVALTCIHFLVLLSVCPFQEMLVRLLQCFFFL